MTYTYDAWGRLKTALTTGSTQYPQWGLSWDYDRFGNRKNQNVTAGSGGSMQMSIDQNTNRIVLVGITSPEYDAAGNMTRDDQWRYVYDAENRIVEVRTLAGASIATYSYDWRGVRIKKTVGGTTTRYVFSGLKVLAEYTDGTLARENIYHGDRLLGEWQAETSHFLYGDQISPRLSADSTGTQTGEQEHFPFGEGWYETGAATKWKFTYHERDVETGLDYATFRYYASRLGRFMTPDPVAVSIMDPQRLNRYAYVLNDPVNLVDPYGLECKTPDGIVVPCPDVTSITVNGSTDSSLRAFFGSLGAFFEGIISARFRPRDVDGARGGTGPRGPGQLEWLTAFAEDCFFMGEPWKGTTRRMGQGILQLPDGKDGDRRRSPRPCRHEDGRRGRDQSYRTHKPCRKGSRSVLFTHGRFTVWGTSSKVLVPRAAQAIRTGARALSALGWVVFDLELADAIRTCSERLRLIP